MSASRRTCSLPVRGSCPYVRMAVWPNMIVIIVIVIIVGQKLNKMNNEYITFHFLYSLNSQKTGYKLACLYSHYENQHKTAIRENY